MLPVCVPILVRMLQLRPWHPTFLRANHPGNAIEYIEYPGKDAMQAVA
jgi:hypothetical protein